MFGMMHEELQDSLDTVDKNFIPQPILVSLLEVLVDWIDTNMSRKYHTISI